VRIARLSVLGVAVLLGSTGLSSAQTIGVPDVSGDQLLFVYDARTSRVPFLTVANPSDETLFIDVAFYSQTLDARLGGGVIELGAAANRVIDPTSDFGGAANGNAGLAVFTPVVSASDLTPVVPDEPIVGGFTLANTQLGSGFGENPFGRLAVTGSGERAAAGATVDGTAVSYERIAPSILVVPVYFNPQTLAPPDNDGNRVVLVTFDDQYGTPFEVVGRSDSPNARFFDGSGFPIADTAVAVDGVLLSNLQAIAGGLDVLTSSGKVFFDVDPGDGSYFGLFSQSLGTFASGQRMPEAFTIPVGNTGPTPPTGTPPTPTPAGGTPTPRPTPTGDVPAEVCADLTATLAYDSSDVAGAQIAISYPASVSIPGALDQPIVLTRVEDLTGVTGGLLAARDDDVTVLSVGLVSISEPIVAGPFARVTFDCTGSSLPSVGDFSCTVIELSDSQGTVLSGGQCSLSLEPR
jgi:hypothetical protein